MKDIYLASYSFGHAVRTAEEKIKTAKDLGFQGVEMMGPVNQELADLLHAYDMKIIDTMESPTVDGFVSNIDLLHQLGIKYVCGTELVSFGNHRQALLAAEIMNKIGKKLHENGLKLYYHNHTHEWHKDQGEYLMETILRNTDPDYVCLQMDTGWALCAGIDPISFIKTYSGRVELMHVKSCTKVLGPDGVGFMMPSADGDGRGRMFSGEPMDMPEGPLPEPSAEMLASMARIKEASGTMTDCIADYKAIILAAEAHGCKSFIIERDEHYLPDPIDCIRDDINTIRTLFQS